MRERTAAASALPSTSIRPLVGATSPSAMRRLVVLPAPLGPRNPRIDPALAANDSPSTAVNAPYLLVTSSRTSAFGNPHRPFETLKRPQTRATFLPNRIDRPHGAPRGAMTPLPPPLPES